MSDALASAGHGPNLEDSPPRTGGVSCILCRGPTDAVFPRLKSFSGLSYRRCRRCGWLGREHVPEHEHAHFRDHYHALTRVAREPNARRNVFEDALERLGPPTGTLLDVGCAEGQFLERALGAGWQVQGLEISPKAAASARASTGATVWQTSLEHSQLEEGRYSVVTLFNLLDQVPDPLAALTRCSALLEPSGRLYARVPNGGFHRLVMHLAEHAGRARAWLLPLTPFHLHFLGSTELRQLARLAGFDVVHVRVAIPTSGSPGPGLTSLSRLVLRSLKLGAFAGAWLGQAASGGRLLVSPSIELWARKAGS